MAQDTTGKRHTIAAAAAEGSACTPKNRTKANAYEESRYWLTRSVASVAHSSPHMTSKNALPNAAISKAARNRAESASPGATARRSRHRAVPPPQSAPATGNMFARSTNGPWRNDSKAATTNPADVNSKVQALARTPMSVDPEGSTNEVHSTSIHHACQNPMPRSRNENGARSASPRPVAPWRAPRESWRRAGA